MKYLGAVMMLMSFSIIPSAFADECMANCKGYAGPGGACYAGPGGPAYSGPGGVGGCPSVCR